jgi:hypothetical protein
VVLFVNPFRLKNVRSIDEDIIKFMALPKRWINVTDPGWMLARAQPRATVLFTKTPLYRSGRKKTPLTINGLKKIGPGWHLQPRAFAPQASVIAAGVRDNVSHEHTCFMRRGEDARLHGRFLYLCRGRS